MRRIAIATIAVVLAAAGAIAVADVIRGTNGPDTLRGTNGDDTLNGRGGADVLIGRRGEDALRGGKGRDGFAMRAGVRVAGSQGDDVIRARDGRADEINCGGGTDKAFVDTVENGVYDCEVVIPPAAAGTEDGE